MGSDRRFSMYAIGLLCLAVVTLALSWWVLPLGVTPVLLVMVVAVVLAEILYVSLGEGSMSMSYPLSVAALALLGPTAGGVVAVACMFPALLRPREIKLDRFVFNLAQLVLCSVAAGWLYLAAGGKLVASSPLVQSDFPGAALAGLVLVGAGVGLNFLLVSVGFAIVQSTPVHKIWRSNFSWMMPTQLALGLVGLVMAQVVAVLWLPGLALFVAPLLVARETYNRYVRLRVAYADTVRSLVAAIEAKDAYTMGHSVRVAEYAVEIGRRMGVTDALLERLEYAALLHDLGKVGLRRSLLSKPTTLTAEEYDEVRCHPDIGASIIESVPYLEDIVPVVRAHHERVDGLGYGGGLSGDQIPVAARILAVADSYDAMTSERPYRGALTVEQAVLELRDGRGSQFDEAAVDAIEMYVAEILPTEMEPAVGNDA